jgi:hypothetical protein
VAYVVDRPFHRDRSGCIQRGGLGSFTSVHVGIFAISDINSFVCYKGSQLETRIV